MKHEMPEKGRQYRPCPECAGQMELRLGMWDCSTCGHSMPLEEDPATVFAGSEANKVSRAKLIHKPEVETVTPRSFDDPHDHIFGQKELVADPFATRMACLGGHVLLAIFSHAYILMEGSVATWIDTDKLMLRIGLQALFLLIVAVGLIWREIPTKFLALFVSTLLYMSMLLMTLTALRVVPVLEITKWDLLPELGGVYWAVMSLAETGLLFWLFGIVMRDIAARDRSRGVTQL